MSSSTNNSLNSIKKQRKYNPSLSSQSILLYPLKMIVLFFEKVGSYAFLMSKILRSHKNWRYYLPLTVSHMFNIGVKSIPIVILTGLFAGMVLAVQASYQVVGTIIPGYEYTMGAVIGKSILETYKYINRKKKGAILNKVKDTKALIKKSSNKI